VTGVLDLADVLADRAGTVVLTQAATPTEARLIRERIAVAGGTDRAPVSLGRVPASVLSDDDTRLVPVRVAWLPEERGGRRAARLHDVLPGHDPYQPSERQQRRILARHPGRAIVLVGEPATVGSLRRRWEETTGGDDFPGYVARRATLALDRAEYRLRGPRYKTPSLVRDEILSSRRFREGLRTVSPDASSASVAAPDSSASVAPGGSGVPSLEEAGEILDELAAGWSRRLIDIMPTVGRLIFQRGFDPQIDYDAAQVERLRAAMERHPGILLWSHRSNLDTLVLAAALQEQGIPPAHLFAGINMAFGPMGAIMRRAGVIFIRRSTSDDPLYKYVLREYVGYVLEKRFNLSWSIEGTRSRTGKMLPPRLGLLAYAADAYLQGRVDDIALLPVSITFDQLHEISEYAAYARGAAKKPEGFSWLYGFIKAQGARHYGKVYVRFGEPVLLSSFLGPVSGGVASVAGGAASAAGDPAVLDPAARRLALQKTAFEVAWRINQGMPVTATAIVTTVLLAMQGAALTFGQMRLGLGDALSYLESRSVPRTASARALSDASALRATLDALVSGGLVTLVRDGREPVWLIGPEHQLAATFYRNSLIHFLLDTALCELAVLRAGETSGAGGSGASGDSGGAGDSGAAGGSGGSGAAGGSGGSGAAGGSGGSGAAGGSGADPVAAFWEEIARLRDLLKFEFYFKDREEHWRQVGDEMSRHDPAWEDRLRAGQADALLAGMRPLVSHIMVRPFVEAYRIVADVLVHDDVTASSEDSEVTNRALGLGQQYVAQRRLRSSESVSVLLFQTGLQLARNRGLFEPTAGLAARRADFLAELRHLVRRLDQIEDLAIKRYIRDAVSVMPAD
jgi:glycerol-3-phosphate O-acyltransferase